MDTNLTQLLDRCQPPVLRRRSHVRADEARARALLQGAGLRNMQAGHPPGPHHPLRRLQPGVPPRLSALARPHMRAKVAQERVRGRLVLSGLCSDARERDEAASRARQGERGRGRGRGRARIRRGRGGGGRLQRQTGRERTWCWRLVCGCGGGADGDWGQRGWCGMLRASMWRQGAGRRQRRLLQRRSRLRAQLRLLGLGQPPRLAQRGRRRRRVRACLGLRGLLQLPGRCRRCWRCGLRSARGLGQQRSGQRGAWQ